VMQLTPRKIAAIKALADDVRGDPNTRAAAQAKLEQYRREHPEIFSETMHDRILRAAKEVAAKRYTNNPPNPRRRHTDEFAKWRFFEMDNWKHKPNGNYTIIISTGFDSYLVTLFRHKATPTWGWSRVPMENWLDTPVFSYSKFETVGQAREDAWTSLETI
jgi:hypothetical protein